MPAIYAYLEKLAAKDPNFPLFKDSGVSLTASAVLDAVRSMAVVFQNHDIKPGELVLFTPKRDHSSGIVLFALQAVGAVAVLMDPLEKQETFPEHCEEHIACKHALELSPEGISIDQTAFIPLPSGISEHFIPVTTTDSDPGFLIFTSGTTGLKKAVMLSQANFISNLLETAPLGWYLPTDLALCAIPLHHVFGLALLIGSVVLHYGIFFCQKNDPASILQAIEANGITRMNGVPSMYLAMAGELERHSYDVSSLRTGLIAASPWTKAQFDRIEQSLSMTLISVYGMSECIGISCSSYQDSAVSRGGSSGRIYPQMNVKILLEDGSPATVGEEGEICVSGPSRMIGYYPVPLPNDTLFATGDLGYLDNRGTLHISGRKKDIIIRNGNNLSARKIEEALLSFPNVCDAAVIGIKDDCCGEIPWAAVVLDTDTTDDLSYQIDPIALQALLAKNELPARIFYLNQPLPRNSNGKTDKKALREVLMQWTA